MKRRHDDSRPLGWLVGVALLVLVVNVAVSIFYMVVYGHLIDPGHEEQHYRDYIQVAAPYCSRPVNKRFRRRLKCS